MRANSLRMQPQVNMKKRVVIVAVAVAACAACVSVFVLGRFTGFGSVECECLSQQDSPAQIDFRCGHSPGGPYSVARQKFAWDENEHGATYKFAFDKRQESTAQIDACTTFSAPALQDQYVFCDVGRRVAGDVIPLCGAVMRILSVEMNSFKDDGTPAELEEGGRNPGRLKCGIVSHCFRAPAVPKQGRIAVVNGGETVWAVSHGSPYRSIVKAIKLTAHFGPLGRASRATLTVSTSDRVEDSADDIGHSSWSAPKDFRVSEGRTITVDPAYVREKSADPREQLNCPRAFRVESVVYPEPGCGIPGWIVISPLLPFDQ